MFKSEEPSCVCSRCKSADTIRTEHTMELETWHCYACHRRFEVTLHADPPKGQHGASDRPRNSARSARNDRNRSAKVITQSVNIPSQDSASLGFRNETDW